MDLSFWVPTALLTIWLIIGVLLEPRRFGWGILLAVILFQAAALLLLDVGTLVRDVGGGDALTYGLLGTFALLMLGVLLLGLFLVVNAWTMWRKEGLGLAPRISGAIGVALLGYLAMGVLAVVFDVQALAPTLLFIGLPAGYVGFLFVAFLLYSLLYVWVSNRFGRPVDAVVVLGSGLGGGERVTPLLAGRLRRGREVFEKSQQAGRDPVLIVSGGKGDDERLSEAQAMANWLTDEGFGGALALEDRSTDTEENLEFSADLIRADNKTGRVAVATSDYHAFRAAIIMRKAHIKGYTVGCKTARYYWPSATVREFLAILLEHSRVNLAIIVLLSLPLTFYAYGQLLEWLPF